MAHLGSQATAEDVEAILAFGAHQDLMDVTWGGSGGHLGAELAMDPEKMVLLL